jgi:hypothetical protein
VAAFITRARFALFWAGIVLHGMLLLAQLAEDRDEAPRIPKQSQIPRLPLQTGHLAL